VQGLRPEALVVTADQAGMGKTEFIRRHADEVGPPIVTR
jgi:replicative DNA helicase